MRLNFISVVVILANACYVASTQDALLNLCDAGCRTDDDCVDGLDCFEFDRGDDLPFCGEHRPRRRLAVCHSGAPSSAPTYVYEPIHFYAVADAPYTDVEKSQLAEQMRSIDLSVDFVVHLGDIRFGRGDRGCALSEYTEVADILKQSPVPVLLVVGDNEFNDCPDPVQALSHWRRTFSGFETSKASWSSSPVFANLERMNGRSETFAFTHNGILFIGLNIPGGLVHDTNEWSSRLSSQAAWTKELIREHRSTTVLLAHANPSRAHDDFFLSIRDFLRDELQNQVPLWSINGDKHAWEYSNNFYGQSSWKRIMLTGGTREPPLRLYTISTPIDEPVLLRYDRQL